MHIALLTTYFPPDTHSGIGRYVEDLAMGFIENGHNVEVIAVGKKRYTETYRSGFQIHWLLSSDTWVPKCFPFIQLLLGSYKCRKKLIEQHKKKPFDVIEYPNTGVAGLIALMFKLPAPRPRFIVRLVSPRSIFKKYFNIFRVTELLEALQVRGSDAVLAVSQTNYSLCQTSYQFSTSKPHRIILLGLPTGTEPYLAEPFSKLDKVLRVFFLGRMEDRKGFDVLAKAWSKVATSVPHIKLIVAGEDSPYDRKQSYFFWATKNIPASVLAKIDYFGAINSEQRESFYQQCDICVIPSRYESFGLISLEAMSYGKPVVSSDVGGIPEVVKHGVTGLLVPPEDHKALADALIKLLLDANLREQLGNNALVDVKERFSSERVVKETEDFYRSLL